MERRDQVERPCGYQSLPLVAGQIERFRLERAIAARIRGLGALAVLVIVADRFETGIGGAGVMGVANDQVIVAEMVEQGCQPLLEQGQPVIEPGETTAVGDRLVERVPGRGGAETLAIA